MEINPLKLNELSISDKKKYPFYGQATINKGIIGYFDLEKNLLNNKKNKPTILIHSNNQNIVYLDTPFYLKDGHGATSVLQAEWLNKLTGFYVISAIDKAIRERFSYNAKATKIVLKNTIIKLSTKNNKPDYDFMARYIKIIQKQVIKKLAEWTQKEVVATKEILDKDILS
ncbi:hypothetical protein Hs30E_00300 [Lactococcus hodotermopsidis]|uniref:Type I restriction modification DNA specificity domain-containing protein n=1 Tax=Pseudolactococcus hodotermopsidis TaxID=2709157 RepID=A0A6A0B7U0_9LACT|nr:hypothetical protein [Lactococcus hodotermopsidis]GFH41479.1 hypothetical protein Hs30E_00300 [Lactococcus hodotermopsidis]